MARHVYDNAMVAHVWAQGTEESGRSHNGQFYFEGKRLYSYGSHFLVGLILDSGEVLLNASTYGITTTRHQSYASYATHHRLCFHVPELTLFVRDVMTRPDAVRKFVAERILGMGENVAAFLLRTFAGDKKPAATVDRMIDVAHRDVAKRKAKEEARVKAGRLRDATNMSGMSDADKAEWLGRVRKAWNPIKNLRKTRTNILRAQIEAKKVGRTRQVKILSALRKEVSGYLDIEIAKWDRKDSNRSMRSFHIPQFKRLAARHLANESMASYDYNSLASLANAIADCKGLQSASRDRFRAIASEAIERAAQIRVVEQAAEELNRIARAKEAFERETQRRENWLRGDTGGYWRGTDERGGALLRVRGDNLETSQGATVPLDHAIKAFKVIKRCRDAGVSWKRNGETIRVGHFQIDTIEPTGDFTAGCHRIGWNEVERIARSLGIFE